MLRKSVAFTCVCPENTRKQSSSGVLFKKQVGPFAISKGKPLLRDVAEGAVLWVGFQL